MGCPVRPVCAAVRRNAQDIPSTTIGNRPMVSIERKDVLALDQRMSGTPNQANRMLRTLSLMYSLAADEGRAAGAGRN